MGFYLQVNLENVNDTLFNMGLENVTDTFRGLKTIYLWFRVKKILKIKNLDIDHLTSIVPEFPE